VQQPCGDHRKGEIEIVGEEPLLTACFASDPLLGTLYQDRYVTILRDPVRTPSGDLGAYLRILPTVTQGGKKGTAVLGVLNGAVLLLRVYRHALRAWEWSIPRGFAEPGEALRRTAVREWHEETVFLPRTLYSLGCVTPDSGLLGDRVELFFAEIAPGGSRTVDELEAIGGMALVPVPELLRRISEGDIEDAFTIVATMRAQHRGLL
jgi:ADP-ribose pyrophosphatase